MNEIIFFLGQFLDTYKCHKITKIAKTRLLRSLTLLRSLFKS